MLCMYGGAVGIVYALFDMDAVNSNGKGSLMWTRIPNVGEVTGVDDIATPSSSTEVGEKGAAAPSFGVPMPAVTAAIMAVTAVLHM
jgi:hypothetical protein